MATAELQAFAAANDQALDEIAAMFADYEPRPVDRARLLAWLNKMQRQHWPLGLKLLHQVRYYKIAEIMRLMAPLRELVRGQLEADGHDEAHAVYVPYGRPGESGNDILRRYRNVNHLQNRADQFLDPTALTDWCLRHTEPIVFLDDFVGTGKQVSDNWDESFGQLVPPNIPTYLAVLSAFGPGIDNVHNRTRLRVLNVHTLDHKLQLKSCPGLAAGERRTIEGYCNDAENEPLGFGGLGLLVSFAHSTPNNAISVLRGSKGQRAFPGILPGHRDLVPEP